MLGCTQGHTISGRNQRVTCHSQTQDPSEFFFVSLKVNTCAEKGHGLSWVTQMFQGG